MRITLRDGYRDISMIKKEIRKQEYMYSYYKKAIERLNRLINGNLDIVDYWYIIDKYYNISLFNDLHDTIMTCKLLGIKYKRLNTDFIAYEKSEHAPKYYFQDWIIMETGKVDTRKIYSKEQIDDLLDSEQMVVLYQNAFRPASKKLKRVFSDDGVYITYNDHFVEEEDDLLDTHGTIEYVTCYPYWDNIEFNIYNNPDIQNKMREKIFTKERIEKDIEYYRFRALEVLKCIRENALNNNINISNVIEEERKELLLKRD